MGFVPLLLIILCMLNVACAFFPRNKSTFSDVLYDKSKYITFKIEKIDNDPAIKDDEIAMIIKNISNEVISIHSPKYFGWTIYPFMTNSQGESLQINTRISVTCKGETIRLKPLDIYREKFIWPINKFFNYSKRGIYYLKIEYYGKVLNAEGEIISNDNPLTSNILEYRIE